MREDLVALIQPLTEALGFELWGIEYRPYGRGRSLLRVYIAHENGIGVDDCEAVSRQISRTFDVEDPIRGEYILEVSSPGMYPQLFTPSHFQTFCGERIQVKTHQALNERKNFKGKLLSVNEDSITLEEADTSVNIHFENIAKATVVGD
jgi:ribosome maturation factor RimP